MEGACPFEDYPTHIRFLRGNMNRGHDNFVVFHGPEGAGKTTDAMNFALDLNPDFDIRRDVIRSHEQMLRLVIRRADQNPKDSANEVVLVDEGADLFLNRDWNTIENKEGTKVLRKARILRGTWLVNIPDFEGLDPWIREHRCWQRIYQPSDFDADGYVHTEGKVLWRTERFDYNEQRVMHRWTDVYDLDCPSLDLHPKWLGYEADKRGDLKAHAERLLVRLADPKRTARLGHVRRPKGQRAANTPPTTT